VTTGKTLKRESNLSKGPAVLYKDGVPKLNLKSVFQGILLAILYILAGRLATQIHNLSGQSPLIWLPTGISVAAVVLFGTGLLPWVFIASVILNGTLGYSPVICVGVGVGSVLQTWLSAWSLAKVCDSSPTLTKVKEVIGFGVLVMGLSGFIGATIQAITLIIFGSMTLDAVYTIWRSWWLAQAMSCLIIAAPCICWWNDIRFRLGRPLKLKWEAAFLGLIIVTTCIFLYTPLAEYNHSLIVRPFLLFSFMIWAAVRFDVFGVTTTLLVLATTTICGNILGFTAASTAPLGERMILQQYFTMALGFTGLVISAAIREKESALEMRNEFLSIASHELKTPIAALSLQLQIAERKLRNKSNPAAHETEQLAFLEKTGLQISRLVQIVEQLLDVSRIDRKIVSLQFEKINLGDFISGLVERLDSNLRQAGCTISLHLQNDVYCNWDSVRFEQVFENLISNAIKYAAGKPIRIETKDVAGVVEIAVRDNGPGIEKSKQTMIFDRFVRANSSPQIKGLGLGLFITRQIIETHGGTIWVEGKMGEGTSFLMKIPAHPAVVDSRSAT
jgi:signal transduction histidine kinase